MSIQLYCFAACTHDHFVCSVIHSRVYTKSLCECAVFFNLINEGLTLFLQPCVWEEKEGNTCKGV